MSNKGLTLALLLVFGVVGISEASRSVRELAAAHERRVAQQNAQLVRPSRNGGSRDTIWHDGNFSSFYASCQAGDYGHGWQSMVSNWPEPTVDRHDDLPAVVVQDAAPMIQDEDSSVAGEEEAEEGEEGEVDGLYGELRQRVVVGDDDEHFSDGSEGGDPQAGLPAIVQPVVPVVQDNENDEQEGWGVRAYFVAVIKPVGSFLSWVFIDRCNLPDQ